MMRWWECLRNSYSAVASVRDTSPVRCFAGRERLENWQIVLQDTSTTLAVGISLWATHWIKRPRGAGGRSWELWEDQMGRSLESIWVEEGKPQITRISSTPSALPPHRATMVDNNAVLCHNVVPQHTFSSDALVLTNPDRVLSAICLGYSTYENTEYTCLFLQLYYSKILRHFGKEILPILGKCILITSSLSTPGVSPPAWAQSSAAGRVCIDSRWSWRRGAWHQHHHPQHHHLLLIPIIFGHYLSPKKREKMPNLQTKRISLKQENMPNF